MWERALTLLDVEWGLSYRWGRCVFEQSSATRRDRRKISSKTGRGFRDETTVHAKNYPGVRRRFVMNVAIEFRNRQTIPWRKTAAQDVDARRHEYAVPTQPAH